MVIDKLFLECSVESFAMSVHLGSSRVGMEMGQVKTLELCFEFSGKLASVVGEYKGYGKWEYLYAQIKEFTCRFRGVRTGTPSESESGEDVLEADDVSPCSIYVFFDSIESHKMPGIGGDKVFWLS